MIHHTNTGMHGTGQRLQFPNATLLGFMKMHQLLARHFHHVYKTFEDAFGGFALCAIV
jgi:hypothetical protein